LLDLDSAQSDSELSTEIAKALQSELSARGPARVTAVSNNAITNPDSGVRDEDTKTRWKGTRTALQGTRRIRNHKLRVSLRLVNTVDGKVLYRRIIETDISAHQADTTAKLIGANIYNVLDTQKTSPIDSIEDDPGWHDKATRELLIAGKAVMEQRRAVDLDRAIGLFAKATKDQPRSAIAYSYLAQSQQARAFLTGNSNDTDAALTSANRALQLNTNLAEPHKAMSGTLFYIGQFRDALEEAFVAYELVDGSDGALADRVADNLRTLGEPAKAANWYRLGTMNRPGVNEYMIADSLSDLVDDENAAAIYRRVSTLLPEQPEGWIGLCRLALLQKDLVTAHKIASENWERYREFTFSQQMAAQVEFFSRNFVQAEKLYQELAAKDPNGGGSFYGAVSYQSALGRLRLAAGDQKAASQMLENALASEMEQLHAAPHHPEILYRAAAVEASLGKSQNALSHLEQAFAEGWIEYRSLDLDPRFDALRGNSRFNVIFEAMKTRVATLQESVKEQKMKSTATKEKNNE